MSNGQPGPKGVKLEYDNVNLTVTDNVITLVIHTKDNFNVTKKFNQKTGEEIGTTLTSGN